MGGNEGKIKRMDEGMEGGGKREGGKRGKEGIGRREVRAA